MNHIVKQSAIVRRVLVGLALLGVLTVGRGPFAAQAGDGFTPVQSKADGNGLVAAGAVAVGIGARPRRT
jgi:hypothetical protein